MFFKLFFLFLTTSFLYAYPSYTDAVKEKKIYPMGEKIYEKRCKNINAKLYETYEQMQEVIHKKSLCQPLSPTHFEAMSLYLWDFKEEKSQKTYPKLKVTKDEKCPVCGMFLHKYPTWISRINYENESFAFDGNKDMMKYYFSHKEGIKEMLVQDYYTRKTLNAQEAFFVIGSDVYGPMGNELIAFEDEKSAKQFLFDHRAKEILQFNELSVEKVYKLDE